MGEPEEEKDDGVDASSEDAGAEETQDTEGGAGDASSEDSAEGDESSDAGSEGDSEDSESEESKPFQNLDLREWYCFGLERPKKNSWTSLAYKSRTSGWKSVDVQALERSLKKNVDASYVSVASFYLVNLDDDIPYHCWFDNIDYLWKLELTDSPKAEIELEDKAAFFGSDMFKRIAERTKTILSRAMKDYEEVVDQRIRNGELLQVDEVKLSAITYLLAQKITLENVASGKWAK